MDIGGYEAQARNPVAESAMGNIYNKNHITESLHYKRFVASECDVHADLGISYYITSPQPHNLTLYLWPYYTGHDYKIMQYTIIRWDV